jgi:Domain of unknown function (DUF2017)
MSARIRRHRRGHVLIELDEHERRVLGELVDQLRTLLMSGTEPSLRRLFPTAYPDDTAHEREFQALVHNSLLEHRLRTLEMFEGTLGNTQVSVEELGAWMGALNDLRLVLGTSMDVSEDDAPFDPGAEDAFAQAVYHFLGALLEQVVEVLSGTLGPATA